MNLLAHIKDTLTPALETNGVNTFGVFQGLFGLASNELYLVTYQEADGTIDVGSMPGDMELIEQTQLVPTVRPTTHAPRDRDGIYVFRWFTVKPQDVDEIARLSETAWQTFESGFATEVQALFAEPDRAGVQGTMLLITWYEDLNAWQDSRAPAPEARANFAQRHALTLEAKPIATRLVSQGMGPIVPGGDNRFR